jgi:hypothetical protein
VDPRTAGPPPRPRPLRRGRGAAGNKDDSRADVVVTALARLVGAGLLGAMAGIHFHLWDAGYRSIDTIGPLFLLNGVSGAVAALAVVAAPRRWLGWAAAAGAALQAGTLAGLALSLTVGLFGFTESTKAELVVTTIWVESAGTVVLAGAAARELLARLRAPRRRGAD